MYFKIIYLLFVLEVLCFRPAIAQNTGTFESFSIVNGKICPPEDVVISNTAPSLLSCSFLCFAHSTCVGIFYNEVDSICTGCSGTHVDPAVLVDSPGTVYFKQNVCEPLTILPYVDYSQYTSNKVGSSFPYTCKMPCGSYPLPDNNMITCQPEGTWTVPQCWNSAIPEGAPGCISTYGPGVCGGSVASSFYEDGSQAGCYCDAVCCGSGDCCYDNSCPP
ncbi:hypothetical protein ACF0H5_007461 [Mactra antiquata]